MLAAPSVAARPRDSIQAAGDSAPAVRAAASPRMSAPLSAARVVKYRKAVPRAQKIQRGMPAHSVLEATGRDCNLAQRTAVVVLRAAVAPAERAAAG